MKRFANKEEMAPFLELCWAGKLFEVQEMIRQGSPVNPPLFIPKKPRINGPLECAMHLGFYSLVQVLLEAGANVIEPSTNDPIAFRAIYHAVEDRRMDLIELLVKYGADVRDVQWETILHTWRSDIIHYCIEHGADLEDDDNPIAYALQRKIRPALGIYKTYEHQIPDLKRQINIALRYHTRDQNQKWASLLLWAGADPYDVGPEDYNEWINYGYSALEIALRDNWAWMLKQVKKLTPTKENACPLLTTTCRSKNKENVTRLLDAGFLKAMSQSDISELVGELMLSGAFAEHESASILVVLDLILKTGAKWDPDPEQMKQTRRRMINGRSAGFKAVVMLLKKHNAATKEVQRELIRTGAAQRLLYSK